jgi:glycogen operon protein
MRMVLDSLRYWVEIMGVDGFRFDLATTLGREEYGFDANGGFFDAMRQDPVLSQVHLIAEPWDIGPGGYQLGHFPPEFLEWNDRFRDSTRRYWRGDDQSSQELAASLLGTATHFDRNGRRAWTSVNLVTAHDGFTMADLTRYNEKHNLSNGENGRDGHHSNFSDNCGVEGETDDPSITARRERRQRNLLATLFLSQGTPMLLAGDEISNSQEGNNNAYCQDNATGWVNWAKADHDMLCFVQGLSALRHAHPSLRQSRFLHGELREDNGLPDAKWTGLDGNPVDWRNSKLSAFGLVLRESAETAPIKPSDDALFLAFNRSDIERPLVLPDAQDGYHWMLELNTAEASPFERVDGHLVQAMPAEAILMFSLQKDGEDDE